MKKINILLLGLTFSITSFGIASASYYIEFPTNDTGYGNNYNNTYYSSYPTYTYPYTNTSYVNSYQSPQTYTNNYYRQSYQYTSGCTIYYYNGYNGQTTAIGTTCNTNYSPYTNYYQNQNQFYQYPESGWEYPTMYSNTCNSNYYGGYSLYGNNNSNCRQLNTSCYYANGVYICN